jgi:DNA-binding response OmpR family regulator
MIRASVEAALPEETLEAGPLEIRPAELAARADGRLLPLTAREMQVLSALARRRDRIVTREELYAVVWGQPYRRDERSVDVYVGRLRGKLADALPEHAFIHTHFGLGYRFSPEPAPSDSQPPAGASQPFHTAAGGR